MEPEQKIEHRKDFPQGDRIYNYNKNMGKLKMSGRSLKNRRIGQLTVFLIGFVFLVGIAGHGLATSDGSTPTVQTEGGNASWNLTSHTPSSDSGENSITLITGDTVRISERERTPTYRLTGDVSATKFEIQSETHIVPESVNLSKFDMSLFNIDLLRDQSITNSSGVPVIIEWNTMPDDDTNQFLRQVSIHPGRQLEIINATAATVPKRNAKSAFRALTNASNIESVHYDGRVRAMGSTRENINLHSPQLGSNLTGEGVNVAVLDSGINESHPDISGDEVDEVDLVGDGSVGDAYNHGTPVAGLITGDGTVSNGSYVGVAPDANVLDIRVLDASGYGNKSTIIDGIQHAIRNDADLISMSLGIEASSVRSENPFHDAIKLATSNETSVVTTAGNFAQPSEETTKYGTIKTPGILKEVITVGATSVKSHVASLSRRGPTPVGKYLKPDLVAPGANILSPDASSTDYETFNGTSFSTPLVTGTAALLLQEHPEWSPRRIKNTITSTADPIGSANVYEQGAGELNVATALDQEIEVDPTTIDFGRVPIDRTVTRTVTIRNGGTQQRQVEISATALEIQTSTPGNVSLNRTSLTLPANSSTTVTLSIDTRNALGGPYSGRLQVGNATAIFGYVPQRPVKVSKRPLGSMDGNRVTLVNTNTDEVYGPKPFTDGEASFQIRQSGDFVALSTNQYEGQPVLTAKKAKIDRSGHIVLDESETVKRTIDTTSFPEAGTELANRTIVVNGTLDTGPVDLRAAVENTDSATVRVSPTPAMTYAIRRVMTVSPEEEAYNTSKIYHLQHVSEHVTGPAAKTTNVDSLNEQQITYYRGFPGETYNATLGAAAFDDVTLSESYVAGGLGTTINQTVYVSPAIEQYHDSFITNRLGFVKWSAKPQPLTLSFDSQKRIQTAVKKLPFRAKPSRWSLSEDEFSATIHPTVGQPPHGYIVSDVPPERYDLWVNGQRSQPLVRNSETVNITTGSERIESVRLRVYDQHDMSPLSNTTVTTFIATTRGSDTRPPTVPDIAFGRHGKTNVVPNGTLNVTLSASDSTTHVENVSLYIARKGPDGVPATNPFETEDGWKQISLENQGDGAYKTTLDLGRYRGTLSIAARAVDQAGNAVETTATNAVVVGSRSPTARSVSNSTLVSIDEPVRFNASGSYDDLAIEEYRWDLDGDGSFDERTKEPDITYRYQKPGPFHPTVTVTDHHGFENTTDSPSIAVTNSVGQWTDDLDNRTSVDIRTAAEGGDIRVTEDSLNGRETIDSKTLFTARANINGGFKAQQQSTVYLTKNQVNGHATGHNVISAGARFNAGIEAHGTISLVQGATTVHGGITSEEAIEVLPNNTLTVHDELKGKVLSVGRSSSVIINGEVEVGQLSAGNETSITIRGILDCEAAEIATSSEITVHGENNCPMEGDEYEDPDEDELNTESAVTIGSKSVMNRSTKNGSISGHES